MITYICKLEILKTRVLNRFSVHNIHFYLCGQVENTNWIKCSQKGVKCAYLGFLMYKEIRMLYFKFLLKRTQNIH
jgi:hypothetical protein